MSELAREDGVGSWDAGFRPDVLAAHANLGEASAAFLDEVSRDPSLLRRGSFARLFERSEVRRFTAQPWPTFVGPAKVEQMATATRAVDVLIKRVPERIFGRSPEK